MESRGADDPDGRYAGIKVNGREFAKNTRGFNIVVVDGKTGRSTHSKFFDKINGVMIKCH